MQQRDKQIDLEKRTNLQTLNFQVEILPKNQIQTNLKLIKGNQSQNQQHPFQKHNEESNLIKQIQYKNEYPIKAIILSDKNKHSADKTVIQKIDLGAQIQNQQKIPHIQQKIKSFSIEQSRNQFNEIQSSQVSALYQVPQDLKYNSQIAVRNQEINPLTKNLSVNLLQDNKQLSKNNNHSLSGKQILQQKLLSNNDLTYQQKSVGQTSKIQNNAKKNNIFDSVSIMDHSKKPIVIKEVSPQIIQQKKDQEAPLNSTTFFQTSLQTKLFVCSNCLNKTDIGLIQLNCYHNYHNFCLEEKIKNEIYQGFSQFYCQCNTKIPQKFILKLFENNTQIKDRLFKNQLQTLIDIFQNRYKKSAIQYDSNPQIILTTNKKFKY